MREIPYSYLNCENEMEMKKWSSSERNLCNCMNCVKKPEKIQDFNGVWTRDLAIPVRCFTNWAMKPLTLGAGQLWVHMFPWKKWVLMIYEVLNFFQASLRKCINCVHCDHFHFISAVHMWFISYIINTHFFHGNIWTHNWPAPNVSGFIAQLVEHRTGIARSRVQTPLKSWIFFFQASLRNCVNCLHCDDHFFTFISFPQFIYDLFHISLTL